MKKIVKFLMIVALISTYSCSDSEAIIDQVLNNVGTGYAVRVLEGPAAIVAIDSETNPDTIDFTLEIQRGNGSLAPEFKEVRLYLSLFSNATLTEPLLDDNGNPLAEVLFETIDSSLFSETSAVNGLPMYPGSIPAQQVIDSYPTVTLPSSTFAKIRIELEANDGTVYSEANAGGTLGGAYFNSSFVMKFRFRT